MILHVVHAEKFIAPFVELVNQNFDRSKHLFFVMGNTDKYPVQDAKNVVVIKRKILSKMTALLWLSVLMNRADKIMLHGLFRGRIILLLLLQFWLLKKCYWFIWGKDLYTYQVGRKKLFWRLKELIRRPVIRNIGNLVTYVKGDFDLAREWYGATGRYHECILYPSNIYQDITEDLDVDTNINIQVGNSADPSNEHVEIFNILHAYKDRDIKVYVPISYGDNEYRENVALAGRDMLGEKFIPMTEFMPISAYIKFLNRIDIAIFNHKRQQGMGNVITLLGLGKKVYMRKDISSWDVFAELGVQLFDVANISIDKLDKKTAELNSEMIKRYFSKPNLCSQLTTIFAV